MRSFSSPYCRLCGHAGHILYEGLQDFIYGVPGLWTLKRCPGPDCGLLWLDPLPVEEDIGRAYARYYTHSAPSTEGKENDDNIFRRSCRRALNVMSPTSRERERLSLMYLDDCKPGRLLDVGCGNGHRLARLRAVGWDVVGQDIDPRSVAYARERFGLEVHLAALHEIQFPEMSFDAITLNHVIEHTHDPINLLKECRRLLSKRGQLVMVTPNAASFAHRHFAAAWRGLEPPRHIQIFSPKTLSTVANRAGLTVCSSWTTVANATTFWRGSLLIKNHYKESWNFKYVARIRALAYLYRALFAHLLDEYSGEECVLRATA